MKIGSGWQKNNDAGDTYISVAIDDTVLELFPQLKNCNISLSWLKEADRKSEKSPNWTVSVTAKKRKETEEIPF